MLIRIRSALRAGIRARAERLGPFLAHFDAHSDNPYRNYAIPDDAASPTAAEIATLIDTFRSRGRRPRLEFVAPEPAVERALQVAGFTVDQRLPLMTLADAVPPAPPGVDRIDVTMVSSQPELTEAAAVQNAAYGEGPPGDGDVDRLLSTVRSGGGVALARVDRIAVGSGLFTPAVDGLCEIAAVGVAVSHRRRGIGSAVALALSRAVLSAGAVPYLQTETENEQRLYGALGYRTVGELVAISLPTG